MNDNYPFFLSWLYEGSVWKNPEIGTPVLRVHAFDEDSDVNSEVQYQFLEANDKFEISDDGFITTKASVGSFVGTWTYEVVAFNKEPMTVGYEESGASRSRGTKIKIYVTDDRPPVFSQRIYTANITENSPPGRSIWLC